MQTVTNYEEEEDTLGEVGSCGCPRTEEPNIFLKFLCCTCSIANWDGYAGCPFVISVAGVSGGSLLLLIAVVLRCTAYVTETTTVTTVTQGSSGGATTSASTTETDDARTSSEETSSEETGWKGGACVGVLFWFAVITGVALLVAAMAHGAFFWVPSVYQPPKRRTTHAAMIPALGPAVKAKNKAVSTRTSDGAAAETAPPPGSQQGGDAPADVDIISEGGPSSSTAGSQLQSGVNTSLAHSVAAGTGGGWMSSASAGAKMNWNKLKNMGLPPGAEGSGRFNSRARGPRGNSASAADIYLLTGESSISGLQSTSGEAAAVNARPAEDHAEQEQVLVPDPPERRSSIYRQHDDHPDFDPQHVDNHDAASEDVEEGSHDSHMSFDEGSAVEISDEAANLFKNIMVAKNFHPTPHEHHEPPAEEQQQAEQEPQQNVDEVLATSNSNFDPGYARTTGAGASSSGTVQVVVGDYPGALASSGGAAQFLPPARRPPPLSPEEQERLAALDRAKGTSSLAKRRAARANKSSGSLAMANMVQLVANNKQANKTHNVQAEDSTIVNSAASTESPTRNTQQLDSSVVQPQDQQHNPVEHEHVEGWHNAAAGRVPEGDQIILTPRGPPGEAEAERDESEIIFTGLAAPVVQVFTLGALYCMPKAKTALRAPALTGAAGCPCIGRRTTVGPLRTCSRALLV
ncbi:unnamed protein product [Amoebophrya sp. A120]|nr:unnamed protein product [Amoebophrya sp. A120]|eukprot:GSA120T00010065001.1